MNFVRIRVKNACFFFTRICKNAFKTVFYRQEKSLYFGVFLEIQALMIWQGQKDLNPRHAVLETAALPTELYPYVCDNINIIAEHKGDVNSFRDIFLF